MASLGGLVRFYFDTDSGEVSIGAVTKLTLCNCVAVMTVAMVIGLFKYLRRWRIENGDSIKILQQTATRQ